MRLLVQLLTILVLAFFGISSWAFAAGSIFLWEDAKIPYCQPWEKCWLEDGLELVKSEVNDIEKDSTASEYIQQVVIYLLGFITLIAVIYIIYAGVRILTSSWEEETIKKSKNTIVYVIIWILVIWLAWTIAKFAIGLGDAWK